MTLSEQPWWTDADQAELDVLVLEFVRVAFEHRPHCRICSVGGPWCDRLRAALDVVLDWRRARILLSRARWLRAQQTLTEFETELARV